MSRRLALWSLAIACACAALGAWTYQALIGRRVALATAWLGDTPEVTLQHPERLALLALLPLGLWGSRLSLANLGRRRRLASSLVRSLLLLTLSLALADPSQAHEHGAVAVAYAVDVSDSVSDEALQTAQSHLEAARGQAADHNAHPIEVVTFAGTARRPADPSAQVSRHQDDHAATDLARALQLAYALLPTDRVRRIVLASDGLETRGDVLAEAQRARALGVEIDVLPMRAPPPAEVAISALLLPPAPEVGQSFRVRVRVHATRAGEASLRLYQDGVPNGLDHERELRLREGENEVAFRSLVRVAGPVRYRAELTPAGPDRFPENNAVETSTWASGKPRVLLIDPAPTRLSQLASALSAADYDVEIRSHRGLPRSLSELAGFDFVVLSNVPAEHVDAQQARAIGRYLRVSGGGFLLAGGDRGFGLGGHAQGELSSIIPVRMDSERHHDEHSLALSLVIDTSGSMSGPKMALAKEAAKAAADLLGDGDLIEVIGFSSTPARIVRLQTASNRTRIARDIGRLVAQGGTAIFPALDAAFQDLGMARARVKHVILLTDGQTQESGIPELARAMRSDGITVSTVGLGRDVNRNLLQQSANLGDGRAYFTDDPNHVPRIFMRETSTVSESSAVEESVRAKMHTPADFLSGTQLASAPMLHGYVATQPRPAPAQVVLKSDLGDPLLARMRVGLGWSLAWTSDLHPRWASSWLSWRGFSRFVGQLVREHMRKPAHAELPLALSIARGELHARVDAIGLDDRFINDLQSTITVSGPTAPSSLDRPLPLVAPGRYATRVPLSGYGAFAVEAVHRREGRVVARSHAQLLHPYPEEYARTEPDLSRLAQVASTTGGLTDPRPDAVLSPRGRKVATTQRLWPPLAGLALGLFLLDLATRRLAGSG